MSEQNRVEAPLLIPETDRTMTAREVIAEIPALFNAIMGVSNQSVRHAERAWRVLAHRKGLLGQPLTLEAVGIGEQLTRERVRQIERETFESLGALARGGFAGDSVRLQPLVTASIAAVLTSGPSETEAVVRDDVLLVRLGLVERLSDVDTRRLAFLFELIGIERVELGRPARAMWTTQVGATLCRAVPRIETVLAAIRPEGATELEVVIEANRADRAHPLAVQVVQEAFPLLNGVERLPDGRLRARLECLHRAEDQCFRLLSDAPGPLRLDDMLRAINAVRPRGQKPFDRRYLSGVLSRDPRFVAIAKTGWWGLKGRDDPAATPTWQRIEDALRRLGRPSTAREIADVMEPNEHDTSVVLAYLHQLRPSHFVLLIDGRWVLAAWPEARDTSKVKRPQRRDLGVTPTQAAVDGELHRILAAADGDGMPIGEAATQVANALGRPWPSAYYYVNRSQVVEFKGFRRDRRVVLRSTAS